MTGGGGSVGTGREPGMGPDDVQEEWFGPLIDATPEELADAVLKQDKPFLTMGETLFTAPDEEGDERP